MKVAGYSLQVTLLESSRADVRPVPIFWKIMIRSETDWAAEVQLLVPPKVSEKNFDESDAICCIVEHAEIGDESLLQLEEDDVDAP